MKNRPVRIRKWIEAKYAKSENGISKVIEGTGCYSDFIYNGHFHTWGLALAESSETMASYSVGLVEMNDGGYIEEVLPSNIQFIS